MENKVYKEDAENEVSLEHADVKEEQRTPEDKNLGERIREARKAKGLTQKQLAELLNITQGAVALVENNKSFIGSHNIKNIQEILEIEVISKEKKSIGDILYYQRLKRGLTQQQFSELLNISRHTLYQLESNIRLPNLMTLKKICSVLNINFFEFDMALPLPEKIELEKIRRKMLAVVDGTEEERE